MNSPAIHAPPRPKESCCNPSLRVRMGAPKRSLSFALVLVLSAAIPSSASAYRTLADDPSIGATAPPVWTSPTVGWDLYASDLSVADVALLERGAFAAFDTWSAPACSAASDHYLGLATMPASAGDGRNTISVIAGGWLERGFPDGRGAVTDVRVRRHEGGLVEIVEADLYLNFDQYDLIDEDRLDLDGVLTHEIGHVFGIAHPCEHEVAGVPECAAADATFRMSALYPDHVGASQRHLSSDDVAGICALYPIAGTCPLSCATGTHCEAGRCIADCAGGDCSSGCLDGECGRESCTENADCVTGRCAEFGAAIATCLPPGAVGTSCDTPSECSSGLCLRVEGTEEATRVCTRACERDAECGTGARCVDVGSDRVCAPIRSRAVGCAVGGPGLGTAERGLLAVGALLALARRRRRCVGNVRRETK